MSGNWISPGVWTLRAKTVMSLSHLWGTVAVIYPVFGLLAKTGMSLSPLCGIVGVSMWVAS